MASPYVLLSGLRFAKAARQVILFLRLVQTSLPSANKGRD
jgi:hypothetical protein